MTNGLSLFEKAKLTITSSLKESESHFDILCKRKENLKSIFPATEKTFIKLTDIKIAYIDQFLYRFTKLQDSFGTRLLPYIYAVYENEDRAIPFLEKLNKLEKLEVVPSLDDWIFLRELCNNLTRDYPESVSQTVNSLNLLFEGWEKIEKMYLNVTNHAKNIESMFFSKT